MNSDLAPSDTIDLTTAPARGLQRVLRLRDLILLIIGTVIGSGIFLVPGVILKAVGNSVTLALSVWVIGGILSLLGALTYGELSSMNPHAGGLYVYIRDCFGRFPAFLFGWVLFFVVSTGSIATLAVAFSNYLGEFIPFGTAAMKLFSVLMIAVIAAVNIFGTRRSADLLNGTTVIKVVAILGIAVALLLFGHNAHTPLVTPEIPLVSRIYGIGIAIVSVLWAYEGWQYATFAAGEVVNPKRDFPLAFLAGVLVLMVTYIVANVGYIAALGPVGVANSNRVAATAMAAVIGPIAAKAMAAVILISIFSAANSIVLTAPRVYYAMAKDGVFFRRLAEVHPRFGTPAFAIGATALWAAALAASGTFEQLLTYVVFVGWMFYALAAGSIFVYRRRETGEGGHYRVPGYPWTPVLFILTVTAIMIDTVLSQPARAVVGIGVVLTGAPAYFIWRRG